MLVLTFLRFLSIRPTGNITLAIEATRMNADHNQPFRQRGMRDTIQAARPMLTDLSRCVTCVSSDFAAVVVVVVQHVVDAVGVPLLAVHHPFRLQRGSLCKG